MGRSVLLLSFGSKLLLGAETVPLKVELEGELVATGEYASNVKTYTTVSKFFFFFFFCIIIVPA